MPEPYVELTAYLASTGLGYQALSALGGASARVRFPGLFQDRPVVWDAEILTLEAYDRQQTRHASIPTSPRTWQQFIEIGAPSEQGVPLRVGLAVPLIDAATVLRTTIMIRNYKRLRPGRHEFGEALTFSSD